MLVVGMHRSGTSLVASIFGSMGLVIGDGPVMPAAADNPRGFFERSDVQQVNDDLLEYAGGSWWAPPRVHRDTWDAMTHQHVVDTRARLDLFGLGPGTWYCKDPRISLLLPVWDRMALSTLPAVICLRNPMEVAKSLHLRDGLSHRRALALWIEYTRRAMIESRNRPALIVDYQELLAAPSDTGWVLRDFASSTGHVQRPNWSAQEVAQLCDVSMRHAIESARAAEAASHLAGDCVAFYEEVRKLHASLDSSLYVPDAPEWVEESLDELREKWILSGSHDSSVWASEFPGDAGTLEENSRVHRSQDRRPPPAETKVSEAELVRPRSLGPTPNDEGPWPSRDPLSSEEQAGQRHERARMALRLVSSRHEAERAEWQASTEQLNSLLAASKEITYELTIRTDELETAQRALVDKCSSLEVELEAHEAMWRERLEAAERRESAVAQSAALEAESLRVQLRQKSGELMELEQRLETSQANSDSFLIRVAELAGERDRALQQQRESMVALLNTVRLLAAQRIARQDRETELMSELRHQSARIDVTSRELDGLRQQLAQSGMALADAEDRLITARAVEERLLGEVAALEARLTEEEAQTRASGEELRARDVDLATMSAILEQSLRSFEAAQSANQALLRQVSDLELNLASLGSSQRDLEASLCEAQSLLRQEEASAALACYERDNLAIAVDGLAAELLAVSAARGFRFARRIFGGVRRSTAAENGVG